MASKCFSKDLMAIEMRKTKVQMNKPVYIGVYKQYIYI